MRDDRVRLGAVAAVVLLAANLRPAVVVVAPLLPDIRHDTNLSGTAAALLTSLPVLCFGLLAPIAPLLARRFGLVPVLTGVLIGLAAGSLLRLPQSLVPLFAGTVLAGTAIAVGNVLLPVLIKRDFAARSGTMMGLYSVALSGGAALAAGLAVPLRDVLDGRWSMVLALWAVPAVLAVIAWLPLLRRETRTRETDTGPTGSRETGARDADSGDAGTRAVGGRDGNADGASSAPASRASSNSRAGLLREPLAWQITLFMGLQSLAFYATTAWLPEILMAAGRTQASAGLALSVFHVVGIAASIGFTLTVGRSRQQVGFALTGAALYAAGFVGLIAAPVEGAYLWAVILGLAQGLTISLALALILLRMPDTAYAARMSGMAQGFGYLLAAGGPVLLGALHDLTDGWSWPLIALIVLVLPLAGAGAGAGRNTVLGGGDYRESARAR